MIEHGRRPDPSVSDAPVLVLGPGERWALEQVRRHGVWWLITVTTLAAVAAALLVVVVSLVLLDGFSDTEYTVRSFVMGIVAPAIIAPPLLLVSARLVAHLDTATRLLQQSAITDPLTGVANRRGFFMALDELSGEHGIEIAMVDVDDFKAINDERGHPTGDTALCMVAAWLEDHVGERGTVGRLGGDEFAFVATADPRVPTPERHDFRLGETTFSISIGRARATDGDPHAALLDADDELYRLKASRPGPARPKLRTTERGS